MRGQSKQARQPPDAAVERLVVLQVAGVPRGLKRNLILAALGDLGRERVQAAIESLHASGVEGVLEGRDGDEGGAERSPIVAMTAPLFRR